MTVFYMVLIIIGLSLVIGVLTYSLFKTKSEYKDSQKNWKAESTKLKEKINEQTSIINGMETGDKVTDFNNSVDILHKYSQKK